MVKTRAAATLAVLLAGCAFSHSMRHAGIDPGCRDEALTSPAPAGGESRGPRLEWVRSAEERDRNRSADWCETVGGAVIVPVPGPGFPTPSPEDTVAFVTWNMHVGGGDLIAFLDHELGLTCSDLRPGRQTTAAPFVLLVQEVFRRSDRLPVVESSGRVPWTIDPQPRPDEALDIVEIAGLCGLSLVYVPSARNGPDTGSRPGEDKGNAILSNLDLADPFAIDLPFEAGRRVAVGADVVAAGGVVRVVSAHLDVASTLFRTLMTGNQTRARQAAGLIEGIDLLEDRRPDLSATVVGVDLNTWAPNETAVLLMRTAFPESPAWDGRNTRGPFPTDHLFVRSAEDGPRASQHRIIENSHRSDHKGRVLFLHR